MEIETIIRYGAAVTGFVLFCLAAVLFKKKGVSLLLRWAEKTSWRADDVVISALKNHILFWIILLGAYVTLLPLVPERFLAAAGKAVTVLFLVSLTVAAASIIVALIRAYSQKLDATVAMSGLTSTFSRLAVYAVGGLMILNSLGISITPILTTLGIGGLAVALALQDTLSNLFAGVHIILARQVKIGDYIQLDTGQEGYVEDINWRITRIRVLPNNNIVLVPNAKLAQIIVTNYYLPQKEISVFIKVGVHYESDLEKVEKVTLEVARTVQKEAEGAVPGFEPLFRYQAFNDFSIDFMVILRVKEFFDQYLVKHEFIKRLHRRFAEEKIVIPFPISALNISQEQAFKYLQKGV